MLESANTEGATSRRVARSRGTEVRSVDSATRRGNDLRRFEGSGSSGHPEVLDIASKSAESLLKLSRGDRRRLRRCLVKTGKRVMKTGQTVAKMRNPMAVTSAIAGMKRVGGGELQAASNAVGLCLFRVTRLTVFGAES